MPAMDTDAAIALVTTTHPHHAEAVRQFEDAVQIYLHPSVVSEFTTVLRRQANQAGLDGNQVARQTLARLLEQPRVRLETGIDHDHAVDRYHASPPLSFTDAVVAEFRWHLDKAAPITFDKALAKAAAMRQTK
jgi:predicted nucleic acid-binding protein